MHCFTVNGKIQCTETHSELSIAKVTHWHPVLRADVRSSFLHMCCGHQLGCGEGVHPSATEKTVTKITAFLSSTIKEGAAGARRQSAEGDVGSQIRHAAPSHGIPRWLCHLLLPIMKSQLKVTAFEGRSTEITLFWGGGGISSDREILH